ncbi:MAG: hypothetical protein RIQ81_1066 [Pseudomonadota bacterium]
MSSNIESSPERSGRTQVGGALPFLNGKPVTDLVWFQTSFIGDIILTTSAMAAAQSAWPGVRQSALTTAAGAAVFGRVPFIDRTFLFSKRGGLGLRGILAAAGAMRAWHRRLPHGSRAVILQAHKSFRSSLVSRLSGLPVITYRETSRLPFVGAPPSALVDRVMPFHESARIAMLLEPFGMARELMVAARPDLGVSRAAISPGSSAKKETKIAIAPGSVWGTKRWLPDRFARLAVELLAKVPEARIVLTGSPDEAPLCEAIERKISVRGRVENLAGKTALKDLPQLFSGFDLVITNDSSPVHYASALNVPTVAIFGATIPQFGFSPLAQKSVVVEAGPLKCRPCSDHGPQTCPESHFRCMKDISVEKVLAAALNCLAGLSN